MNKDVIDSIIGNHLITDEQDSVEIISRGKLYTRNGKPMLRIMNLIMKTILLTV